MTQGGSFGVPPDKAWKRQDSVGHHPSQIFPETPASLVALLPLDAQHEVSAWNWAVSLHCGTLTGELENKAQKYILTAAANDVTGLVRQVDRFEGRAAAFTARALFEHLVNFRDVTESATNTSKRYMDHRHVAADQLGRRRWFLPALDRREQKKEHNRLDGIAARAQRPLRKSLTDYGPAFKNGWAKGTLRDRAGNYDLDEQYEGYRLLSSVIHGSSGGLGGLVRTVEDQDLLRLGPDMDLAALAYEEGLHYFLDFSEALKRLLNARKHPTWSSPL